MLHHANSTFFCNGSLKRYCSEYSAVSLKISFDNEKDNNRFSVDIGSSFKMDGGGPNLHVYKGLCKDGRIHCLNLT